MKCQICNASVSECKGWLERVNEKGVPGVWECRPMCGTDLPPADRIEGAVAAAFTLVMTSKALSTKEGVGNEEDAR